MDAPDEPCKHIFMASQSFVCLFITSKFNTEDDKRLQELVNAAYLNWIYTSIKFLLHHERV